MATAITCLGYGVMTGSSPHAHEVPNQAHVGRHPTAKAHRRLVADPGDWDGPVTDEPSLTTVLRAGEAHTGVNN